MALVVWLMPGRSCRARSTVPMEMPRVCAISRMPGGFVRFRVSVFLRRRSGTLLLTYRAHAHAARLLDRRMGRHYGPVNVHGQERNAKESLGAPRKLPALACQKRLDIVGTTALQSRPELIYRFRNS